MDIVSPPRFMPFATTGSWPPPFLRPIAVPSRWSICSELHATGPHGERQTWFALPAFQPGVAMGAKLVSVMPANPRLHPEIPAVQALYALFDGTDGSPVAIIDATAMTYRKTAADSAPGCDLSL